MNDRNEKNNIIENMKLSLRLHEFRYVYGMLAGSIVFLIIALATTTFIIPLVIGFIVGAMVVVILKNKTFKNVYDLNIKLAEETSKEEIINLFLLSHEKLNNYVDKLTQKQYGEEFIYTLDGSVLMKNKMEVISSKLVKVANALQLEDVSTELARTLVTLYLPATMELIQNYFDIIMVGGSTKIYEDEVIHMLDKISESLDTTIKNILENKEADILRNSKVLVQALERDKYIEDDEILSNNDTTQQTQ